MHYFFELLFVAASLLFDSISVKQSLVKIFNFLHRDESCVEDFTALYNLMQLNDKYK